MKILIVLTSHDELGISTKKTGFWLEEFAAPYYVFNDAGADITLASPQGGKPPLDPNSELPENQTDSTRRFYSDSFVQSELEHTIPLFELSVDSFDAVFYPGGHGPLWDMPDNSASISLIESFIDAGKPVGAVCHAPAALVNARRKNGEFLLQGTRVTGFSNAEEEAVGLTSLVPFLLEDRLKEHGGIYSKAVEWAPYIQVDGNLITGQNPASSTLVAEELLHLLGSKKELNNSFEIRTAYAFGRIVPLSYGEAEQKVREELLKEGFGIMTEINVKNKFAEKLQKDFRNYLILGACNPPAAYEALSMEINLGTLLPCNVVVYSMDDGRTAVTAMDPVAALALTGNPDIDKVAHQIAAKLQRMMASL